MPRHLNEREVGFDTGTIGFPNIGDCMGVVLQTENGLYGFHAMPGDAGRVAGFAQYILHNGLQGNAVHLYGSCIRAKRCNGEYDQWRDEMLAFATGLNYHGPVSGLDMPAYPNRKNGTVDTTYIEYRRIALNDTCRIYYKRMSKMNVGPGDNYDDTPIQRVTTRKGAFVVEAPAVQITQSAQIVRTYFNKGEMHLVPLTGIDTFDAP